MSISSLRFALANLRLENMKPGALAISLAKKVEIDKMAIDRAIKIIIKKHKKGKV